jgi:hypothetical protein
MDVTADEGFKALAVRELDIKPAAVAFDAAEGVELTPVSLIVDRMVDRAKMSPVYLKAILVFGKTETLSRLPLPCLALGCCSSLAAENRFPLGV